MKILTYCRNMFYGVYCEKWREIIIASKIESVTQVWVYNVIWDSHTQPISLF